MQVVRDGDTSNEPLLLEGKITFSSKVEKIKQIVPIHADSSECKFTNGDRDLVWHSHCRRDYSILTWNLRNEGFPFVKHSPLKRCQAALLAAKFSRVVATYDSRYNGKRMVATRT